LVCESFKVIFEKNVAYPQHIFTLQILTTVLQNNNNNNNNNNNGLKNDKCISGNTWFET